MTPQEKKAAMPAADITSMLGRQNAVTALEIGDRSYIVDGATSSDSHDAAALPASDEIRTRYLGG